MLPLLCSSCLSDSDVENEVENEGSGAQVQMTEASSAAGQGEASGQDDADAQGTTLQTEPEMGDEMSQSVEQMTDTDDNSNAIGETGFNEGMTAAHNLIRSELDATAALPDLQWDVEIAAFAQQWADQLANNCGSIEHRDQSNYGENIALAGSRPRAVSFSPAQAVEGWAAEVDCWEFGSISGGSSTSGPGQESCDYQCTTALNASGCGHYTQLVWRDSQRVGCGYATCDLDDWNYGVWVCNYDPPGNFIGQEPF